MTVAIFILDFSHITFVMTCYRFGGHLTHGD